MRVCSVGAPSRTGKNQKSVAHPKKELLNHNALTSFHCILQKQNLCNKFVILDDILKKVVGIANFIRANAMRHRQFQHILMLDDEIINVNLLYHSKVRCLSQGQISAKILSLSEKINDLYCENNQNCKLYQMLISFKLLLFCVILRPSKTR